MALMGEPHIVPGSRRPWNWARGFARLFVIAWAFWAVLVLVGYPVLLSTSRQKGLVSRPTSEFLRALPTESVRSTLPYIYTHDILPNWPWLLVALSLRSPSSMFPAFYFAPSRGRFRAFGRRNQATGGGLTARCSGLACARR
jgi:hypothetical protein